MIESSPKFVQGTYSFTGAGYEQPSAIGSGVTYVVPSTRRSQLIYFRGGNSSAEMVAVHLMCDGKLMRSFAMGAKGAVHVPLAVVEDLEPDQSLELKLAAPAGATGTVIIDLGLMEI